MKTFGENIIIETAKPVERKEGSILLPFTVADGYSVCTVVAVGEGRENSEGVITPLAVKAGDRVMVNAGTGLKIDKDLVLVKEEDIFGIVTDE